MKVTLEGDGDPQNNKFNSDAYRVEDRYRYFGSPTVSEAMNPFAKALSESPIV